MTTDFIICNDTTVAFVNFTVDHTELQQEHDDFIRTILVPYYINQIESLGFFDKVMTIHPVGKASATGQQDHNLTLSIGRAKSVGAAVKKYFDQQKSRGTIARNVNVAVDIIAQGDKEERALIGPPRGSPKAYEEKSNNFRSVYLSMLLQHDVNQDDEKVFCRQILNAKVKATTIPANHLEQKIDELEKKMPPELTAATKQFLDSIKGLAKSIGKVALEGADFAGPEVAIIFKGIEFIVPSDIALLFEFKDSRGRTKQYMFSGGANKVDVGALDIFVQLLSVIKWMTKLPEALKELEEEVEREGGKLNASHEQIEAVKSALELAEKLAGKAKKIFDAVTAKDSVFRKVFGNGVTDLMVKIVNDIGTAFTGEAEVATEFALVHFDIPGVFDIFFFRGAAEVETREHRGSATTVQLDFGAPKNQPLLGFQAHVLMERKFELSFSVGGFEISRGNLVPN